MAVSNKKSPALGIVNISNELTYSSGVSRNRGGIFVIMRKIVVIQIRLSVTSAYTSGALIAGLPRPFGAATGDTDYAHISATFKGALYPLNLEDSGKLWGGNTQGQSGDILINGVYIAS